jgi:hypothetical protein
MSLVLPSITTHTREGGNTWKEKLTEIEELGLREVALFVTGLDCEQRRELFSMLTETGKRSPFQIRFVHAVSSMEDWEFRFLHENFGTGAFNLHPYWDFPKEHELSPEVRAMIYIENCNPRRALAAEDLVGFAGVCLDISHLEDTRRNDQRGYAQVKKVIAASRLGANHISAVRSVAWKESAPGWNQYSDHIASSADCFNYLRNYDSSFFAEFCAIEVENSLAEQLVFRARIESIIAEKRQAALKRAA